MDVISNADPVQQPAGFGSRWVPSLPTSFMAMLNPFGETQEATATPDKKAAHASNSQTPPRPGFAVLTANGEGPPSPSRSTSVMFAEPESRGTSISDSREGSEDGKKRMKRSNRPKTSFSICHPPPASKAKQRLHRRPRSLLQYHKLSVNARPVPAFEVISSANFSIRLTGAVVKIFKAKHAGCTSDVVVLRAEKYHGEEEEEEAQARDVVALICKGKKDEGVAAGKAKVCMADGVVWDVCPLLNGGYEFFKTDEHGLGTTVRWVPKRAKDGSVGKNKRFTFSTIAPNSRRHPIIASLSKSCLDINDSYKMPDSSIETPLATPTSKNVGFQQAMDDYNDDNDYNGQQETRVTDEGLRSIITVTSIYVTFREGWSPCFQYEDTRDSMVGALQRSASSARSVKPQTPSNTPPASPQIGAIKSDSLRSAGSNIFRRTSLLNRSARNSAVSVDGSDADANNLSLSRTPSLQIKPGRARADSNATVLVHRAASNRRKNNQQAAWRPDLLMAQSGGIREASRESTPDQGLLSVADEKGLVVEQESILEQRTAGIRESVARPPIPIPQDSDRAAPQLVEDTADATAVPEGAKSATPTVRRRLKNAAVERGVSTGTERTSRSSFSQDKNGAKEKMGKGSGKWKRRLLCG